MPGMARFAAFNSGSSHESHGGHGLHIGEHDITHYHLSYYFEIAVECINSVAGLIVLFAVLLAGVNLLIIAFNVAAGHRLRMIDPLHYHAVTEATCIKSSVLRIRLMMGEQIALALGLLVASDILDTVIKPSHAYELLDVVKMGFVTVLRTGLAYFLAREIKDLEEDHQHHASKNRQGRVQSANSLSSESDRSASPAKPQHTPAPSQSSEEDGERRHSHPKARPTAVPRPVRRAFCQQNVEKLQAYFTAGPFYNPYCAFSLPHSLSTQPMAMHDFDYRDSHSQQAHLSRPADASLAASSSAQRREEAPQHAIDRDRDRCDRDRMGEAAAREATPSPGKVRLRRRRAQAQSQA